MELAEDISEEYLTCTICFDPYTDPKQLPCLHTFCKRCLSSHIIHNIRRSGSLCFSCPVCRKLFKPANPDPRDLEHWADQFPDNFFIISLKDTLESYHSQSRSIAKGSASTEGNEQCPKHDGTSMDAYCTLGKVGVCSQCELQEHQKCQQHHLKTHKANRLAQTRLDELKRDMNSFKADVTDIKERLSVMPRSLRLEKEKITLDISEHFTALKKIIIEQCLYKERETIETLNEVMKSQEDSVKSQDKECDSLSASLDGTVKLFEKLLSRGSINALCMLDKISSQVDGYKQAITDLNSETKDHAITFVPVDSDLEEMLQKVRIGDIKTNDSRLELKLGNTSCPLESSIGYPVVLSDKCSAEIPEASAPPVNLAFDTNDHRISFDPMSYPPEIPDMSAHTIKPSAPPIESVETPPRGFEGFTSAFLNADPRHHVTRMVLDRRSPSPQTDVMTDRELQIPTVLPMDFYIWHGRSFNGNISNQERSGGIVGVSAVLENHMAVVDRFNRTMKILHILSGRIEIILNFNNQEPWDVTYINGCKQLAVTFPVDRNISFFDTQGIVRGECQRTASVQTHGGYISLSALKNDLIAAGTGKPYGPAGIFIIDHRGTVITTVHARMAYPRCLQTTSDGKLVVCDWTHKCVFLIGTSYQVESYYFGTHTNQLKDPMGAACDAQGRVYILDRKTKAIHVLEGNSSKCLGILYAEHIPKPRLLAIIQTDRQFCRREEGLAIVDFSSGIHVFKIIDKQNSNNVTQV